MKINKPEGRHNASVSRRNFLKTTAAAAAFAPVVAGKTFGQNIDKIRVGLIGCGGRGLYDTTYCLKCSPNVELVAMGDLFRDRLDATLKTLREQLEKKIMVTPETCFTGFDAYKEVLKCDVDLVILTTPPHFRPAHLRAAIEAGKHVFMEKPAAVDPVGVRSVIESAALADKKSLTIVAGTQSRRMAHRMEIVKRIHDGAIGKITSGQCVRIGGGMLDWGPPVDAKWSDMEMQIRRWLFYTWLSGDFIAEMHVDNIDIINWMMGGPPTTCTALGGRQTRAGAKYGDVFDHISAEFEYPGGARIAYLGAQIDGASHRMNERVVGEKGLAYTDGALSKIEGPNAYTYDGQNPDPCLRQHADQINAIREGKPLNEGRRVAESTLTAIMGRMSAYTARSITWEWAMNGSKLDLSPEKYELGKLPECPVAVPGITKLV